MQYQNYYQKKFLPVYKQTYLMLEQDFDIEKQHKQFIQLFRTTYLLLKYYLYNNGLFPYKKNAVFFKACDLGIIDNGEELIQLLNVIKKPFTNETLSIIKDNFFVFKNLKDKFEEFELSKVSSYRLNLFNKQCKIVNDLYEKYDNAEELDLTATQELFNALKTCYNFYCRIIKIILKERGIHTLLPSKLLVIGENQGLINDSQVWLNYIEDLNKLYLTSEKDKQKELAIQIINKYKHCLKNASNNINRCISSNHNSLEFDYTTLDRTSKPLYSHFEINISERSYKIILDYLVNHKNIKYVWLHGSRVKGNARKYSDIDLIIDIDMEFSEICKKDFANMDIPYRIDFTSMYDTSMQTFLSIAGTNARLIYRAEDFD